MIPAHLQYWSVTVLGDNADTLFVADDQRAGAEPFRLVVRKANPVAP